MSITKLLITQIEQGNVVLFLGAGASYGCKGIGGAKIPNGQELSNLLASQFLDKSYFNQPLNFVSEVAINQSDLFTVHKPISLTTSVRF